MKYRIIIVVICLSVLCVIVIRDIASKKALNSKIDREGIITIGKVYKYSAHKKYQNYYYYFYVNNKKVENFEDVNFPRPGNSSIGRFFRVKYLKGEPLHSKILLDQDVNDTISILKAGFKLLEIVPH